MYYILYPDNENNMISIRTRKPSPKEAKRHSYGFAEGGFKTKKDVINRLNWMNIPESRRPLGFRSSEKKTKKERLKSFSILISSKKYPKRKIKITSLYKYPSLTSKKYQYEFNITDNHTKKSVMDFMDADNLDELKNKIIRKYKIVKGI